MIPTSPIPSSGSDLDNRRYLAEIKWFNLGRDSMASGTKTTCLILGLIGSALASVSYLIDYPTSFAIGNAVGYFSVAIGLHILNR